MIKRCMIDGEEQPGNSKAALDPGYFFFFMIDIDSETFTPEPGLTFVSILGSQSRTCPTAIFPWLH